MDENWTEHQRIRVEALRRAHNPEDDADEVVKRAEAYAAFIAGPEAKHPYPWNKSAEAWKKLDNLMWRGPDGKRATTRMDDQQITVAYSELREILWLLPGEEPPF